MPNLLDSCNFSPLLRRVAAGAAASLAALVLAACEHRDDARTVAADCVRSLSTLAPIMGGSGSGSTRCAAAPDAVVPEAPIVRTATAPAGPELALIASAR